MIDRYIDALVSYALTHGLAREEDRQVLTNRILEILRKDDYASGAPLPPMELEDILEALLHYALEQGLIADGITQRDLFDTRLMGALTPMPREVRKEFYDRYAHSPEEATSWFYDFSQNTDYIRRYRIKKDLRWKYESDYGALDITINLSKPEKDPKAIAAARRMQSTGYPQCQLCVENEGYAGRLNHPARQNHRLIPITIAGSPWYFQYSPYVYYNEHCIVLNARHVPMVIDRSALEKLTDFVTLFPHYFVGSNADLPIVGGSILSHEHFQGGRYTFPMETAPVEETLTFRGYEDIAAGIVKWPMSVIRLQGKDKSRLCELGERILDCWRSYTDEAAMIFAQTDGIPHNTITPIVRRAGGDYQMDLVLRNNLTTGEHPLGLYHPHADKHHIKKENIGLIEVMGLAVLPSRLKGELEALSEILVSGGTVDESSALASHASWAKELQSRYRFTRDNVWQILQKEVGRVFAAVLEDAGVYKRTSEGRAAMLRFIQRVNSVLSETR